MFISQFRHLPSAWCTLQETFFDKKRLIHFLQGPGILTQCRSNSSQSHRPAFELIDNGTQYLVVYLIQPIAVYLKDKSTGVTTMDVAKRLLDYGFHAPTIYFPLLFHEAMMIEPTETESKETIDEFINIMRIIAQEAKDNPELVKTAPHNTPIGRVDDVLAAKQPVLRYKG